MVHYVAWVFDLMLFSAAKYDYTSLSFSLDRLFPFDICPVLAFFTHYHSDQLMYAQSQHPIRLVPQVIAFPSV